MQNSILAPGLLDHRNCAEFSNTNLELGVSPQDPGSRVPVGYLKYEGAR